ncbi:MAG: TonB-dependent receptor [Psychrosphaera sp.]|nr:TonB-dependent receptor [Psychrosphaera sp.]
MPYTSKWNVSGLAEYVYSLNNAALVFQVNFDYQSEFYFDQNENPYTTQEGYTLYNARVAYERDNWSVSLWGKNLTDQEYSHWQFDLISFLGSIQEYRGEGRQLGVDVSYNF